MSSLQLIREGLADSEIVSAKLLSYERIHERQNSAKRKAQLTHQSQPQLQTPLRAYPTQQDPRLGLERIPIKDIGLVLRIFRLTILVPQISIRKTTEYARWMLRGSSRISGASSPASPSNSSHVSAASSIAAPQSESAPNDMLGEGLRVSDGPASKALVSLRAGSKNHGAALRGEGKGIVTVVVAHDIELTGTDAKPTLTIIAVGWWKLVEFLNLTKAVEEKSNYEPTNDVFLRAWFKPSVMGLRSEGHFCSFNARGDAMHIGRWRVKDASVLLKYHGIVSEIICKIASGKRISTVLANMGSRQRRLELKLALPEHLKWSKAGTKIQQNFGLVHRNVVAGGRWKDTAVGFILDPLEPRACGTLDWLAIHVENAIETKGRDAEA
ncbi:hypothetical protein B0H14DRAFT_2581955 [Mycena olivaceomarginata]|nr:hypothetical protein B0H14DRAFT_2581955 [Mycena olivaceomarginata]